MHHHSTQELDRKTRLYATMTIAFTIATLVISQLWYWDRSSLTHQDEYQIAVYSFLVLTLLSGLLTAVSDLLREAVKALGTHADHDPKTD